MNNRVKVIQKIFIILFILTLTACSKEVWNDIQGMISAKFGGYTKENPLNVIALPFKPAEKFDAESNIGKIAWQGAVDGIKDTAFFSNGRLKYEVIEDKNYMKRLKEDKFWDDMAKGDEDIKDILGRSARRHKVNGIIYGLYEGDDSALKLIVMFYSDKDDIVLKEKTEAKANFMDLKALRDAVKDGKTLTVKQKELQKKIHEKAKVATTHLLRKYTEGKNEGS